MLLCMGLGLGKAAQMEAVLIGRLISKAARGSRPINADVTSNIRKARWGGGRKFAMYERRGDRRKFEGRKNPPFNIIIIIIRYRYWLP